MANPKSGIKNPDRARRFFDQVSRRFYEEGSKEAYNFLVEEAYRFRSELISCIENQSEDWPPLSSGYVRYKAVHGLDPRMLIAKHKLINSFQVKQDLENLRVVVRVDPEAKYSNGMKVSTVDRIHEFGTATIPMRAHWRPTAKRFHSRIGTLRIQGGTRIRRAITQQL